MPAVCWPPGLAGRILPLAVLIAVIGTTQLQMTEASRILYAFARDRLLPGFLGKISPTHQTPGAALTVLGLIPPIFLIPYLASSSFFDVITHIISSGGELYLLMYFVVAASSVWFYRSQLTRQRPVVHPRRPARRDRRRPDVVLCIYGMMMEAGSVMAVALVIIARSTSPPHHHAHGVGFTVPGGAAAAPGGRPERTGRGTRARAGGA